MSTETLLAIFILLLTVQHIVFFKKEPRTWLLRLYVSLTFMIQVVAAVGLIEITRPRLIDPPQALLTISSLIVSGIIICLTMLRPVDRTSNRQLPLSTTTKEN